MSETDKEREDKAAQVAYLQGRRDSDVDARLLSHENRLNAINGSIERHARATESLEEKIDVVIAAQATQAAIEADRVRQLKRANDGQINKRTFVIGIAGVIVMLLGVIVALLVGVHAI